MKRFAVFISYYVEFVLVEIVEQGGSKWCPQGLGKVSLVTSDDYFLQCFLSVNYICAFDGNPFAGLRV